MENNFGEFLSKKRKEAKLTQKQLGEKLFVTESTISKWEKNKANPDISIISKLANILNVSEHELISASTDDAERQRNNDAKKWRSFVTFWDLFFLISFSITILTCFICNLATSENLNWFWIVFFAIFLAFSFTILPKYIKHKKLVYLPLIQLFALICLLGYCCLYSNGTWFFLASVPIVVAFLIVYVPIIIKKQNAPQVLKDHCSLFCVVLDIALILLLLLFLNFKTNGDWFVDIALILTVYCSIIPLFFVFICRYTKLNKWLKASTLIFVFAPFFAVGYFVMKFCCNPIVYNSMTPIKMPNFSNWSTDVAINSNVYCIIFLSIITISVAFLIVYLKKQKNKLKK